MSLITSDYRAALEYAYKNATVVVMMIYSVEVDNTEFPEIDRQYIVTPQADSELPDNWEFVVAIAA